MPFELLLPELGKIRNTKDCIVSLLAGDWPLSLKEIYFRIKKKFNFSGGYQAVYKSVNELLSKNVLVREGKKYELNISWIKGLQSFADTIETNYYAEEKNSLGVSKKGEDTVILNFSSLFDAEKYLYYFVKNELKKRKNEKVIYEMNNLWKVLFYYRAEYNYYTKLMGLGHKFYFRVHGNSNEEKRAREFYKKIGISIKRKSSDTPTDTIVFADYYIQIFIPEKLKEKMDRFLLLGNGFGLLKLLDEENTVKIIMHKDSELANGLKQKLL